MQGIFSKNIGIKLIIFCLLSLLAVWIIPRIDPSTQGPGSITVLGVGLVITLLTAGVIYFGVNTSLNLPKKFFLFAFLYNALIIIVKFTISPLSIYQTNQLKNFSFEINEPVALVLVTAVVFLLYFIVFWRIYLYFKRKVKKSIPSDAIVTKPKTKGHKILILFGLALLIAIIILIGGGIIFYFPLVLSLFSLTYSLEYLGFVFSGIFGILIALALTGAIYFVKGAFSSAAERAIVLRDITILVSFFWIGAAFLFIYHALWVVYFLILTALWPLRVVVPK